MKQPKIIVIGPVPPPIFGVSNATRITLEVLPKYGFEVTHLDTSDRRDGGNINKLDFMNAYLAIKHIFQLFFKVISIKPDIVYLPISQGALGYFRDAFFIVIGKWFSKAKIILHLRSGPYFRQFYDNTNPLMHFLIGYTVRIADGVIVLGNSLKWIFKGLTDEKKIFVVPNGINPEEFIIKKKYNTNDKPIQICYLSNLIRSKGYFELIQAINILHKKHNIKLKLAGEWRSDDDRNEVMSFIETNGLDKNVEFLGVVTGQAKKQLLSESDIFALPTYYNSEGQPWSILEAMATGLPVVSTNHGCISESVEDGETGIIVQKQNIDSLVNALEMLTCNPDKRELMGRTALNRVNNELNENEFAKKLSKTFYSVLHTPLV